MWRTDNPVRTPEGTPPRPTVRRFHGSTDRVVRPARIRPLCWRSVQFLCVAGACSARAGVWVVSRFDGQDCPSSTHPAVGGVALYDRATKSTTWGAPSRRGRMEIKTLNDIYR